MCVCLSENGLCMFMSAVSSQCVNECGGWGCVNRVSILSGTGGQLLSSYFDTVTLLFLSHGWC